MNTKTTNFIKATASVLGGLIVSLCIVELGFRAAALVYRPGLAEPDPAAYRILCLGDSSTYGQGASNPARFSYPRQLERILREANPEKRIQVFNLGLPGINSSQARTRLAFFLPKISPHLVLVCVGINDAWNLEQSRLLDEYRARGIRHVALKIRSLLARLKSFRFLRLVMLSRDRPGYREPVPEFNARTVKRNQAALPDAAEFRRALSRTLERNFLEMNRDVLESGARIFFLEYHAPGWRHPETIIHELYRSLGLEYLPVLETFLELDRRGYPVRAQDTWHPNDRGYRVLARIVSTELHGRLSIRCPAFPEKPDLLVPGVEKTGNVPSRP
jgi:lysophospholipase L1-like esterase